MILNYYYSYDYLYSEVRVVTLLPEGRNRLDIKLNPGLSWDEFRVLMTQNRLRFGFDNIIRQLFRAYERGLITRVHLQGIYNS